MSLRHEAAALPPAPEPGGIPLGTVVASSRRPKYRGRVVGHKDDSRRGPMVLVRWQDSIESYRVAAGLTVLSEPLLTWATDDEFDEYIADEFVLEEYEPSPRLFWFLVATALLPAEVALVGFILTHLP